MLFQSEKRPTFNAQELLNIKLKAELEVAKTEVESYREMYESAKEKQKQHSAELRKLFKTTCKLRETQRQSSTVYV